MQPLLPICCKNLNVLKKLKTTWFKQVYYLLIVHDETSNLINANKFELLLHYSHNKIKSSLIFKCEF